MLTHMELPSNLQGNRPGGGARGGGGGDCGAVVPHLRAHLSSRGKAPRGGGGDHLCLTGCAAGLRRVLIHRSRSFVLIRLSRRIVIGTSCHRHCAAHAVAQASSAPSAVTCRMTDAWCGALPYLADPPLD